MRWITDKLSLKGDRILGIVVIALMLISLLVVYSSTGSLAFRVRGGDTTHYLLKQLALLVGCYGILVIVQSIHYKYLLSFASWILLLAFGLLILAKVMGNTLNDTERWINIFGISFQPSEVAKLAVIIFVSRAIAFEQTENGCDNNVLLRILWILPLIFLIFMENFSTSVLLGGVCLFMLFVGRLSIRTFGRIIGGLVLAGGLFVAVLFIVPEKQLAKVGRLLTIKHRLEAFFMPSKADKDDSYQSDQAKIAVARGGLFKIAPGTSVQRNFLPHPYSDFIFAIIIEEYGLGGAGIVMLLYLIILYRVGVIVRRCTRMFPAMLVTGLGMCMVLQALINMGVCVGLFPVTGQPLPLVSMGGTSLWFTSAAFGMILSVSHTFSEEGEREAKEKLKVATTEEEI